MKRRRKRFEINPHHISGIYNYCDRWCERCPFTTRCAVFANEQAEYESEPDDGANGAFWVKFEAASEEARRSLDETAEAQGIDVDAFEHARWQAEEREIDEAVHAHGLHKASAAYLDKAHAWLEGVDAFFRGKERDADRDDCVDVISWYHTQIHVKLDRALRGEERGVPDMIADFPKDSDGSAKVALIGMDRSIAAWHRMKAHLPEREDEILEFLIALERLRRATEKTFPAARAFVRPGFDG